MFPTFTKYVRLRKLTSLSLSLLICKIRKTKFISRPYNFISCTAPKWGSLSLRIVPPPFLFSCLFVCSPISSSFFFFFLLQIPRVRLSPDQKMWLGSPRYKAQLTFEQRDKFELRGSTSNMDFLFLFFFFPPRNTVLPLPSLGFPPADLTNLGLKTLFTFQTADSQL